MALPRSTEIPPITEAQAEALDSLHFLAERFSLGWNVQKGDIQYINNLSIFHARDGFRDDEKQRYVNKPTDSSSAKSASKLKSLRDFRHQTQHYATDRDNQIIKAARALEHIDSVRVPRAQAAGYQRIVEELYEGLAALRKDNDKKRDRLRILRESLASRRRHLSAVKLQPPHPSSQPSGGGVSREAQELASLSATIARARSGLVQELVEVFNVVEVGGRPPIGGKAGTKGEWTIGDLILPVPGDIRRYPPDHINAVITHTIHFLSLLTFYLGIKLPFEITWSGKKLGVGQPFIGAIKGAENGGWAKWYKKHPLHLSSAPTVSAQSTSSRDQSSSHTGSKSNQRRGEIPADVPVTESYYDSLPPEQPQSSFTTALAMLLYDVCYLAWTQNVEVPLSQAGKLKCSPLFDDLDLTQGLHLGIHRRSHEATPLLPPPTPATFPLDFAQLLQATSVNPASRARASRVAAPVATSSNRSNRMSTTATGARDIQSQRTMLGEKIDEEVEDDWDLVDEDIVLD
ncbi:hypothetical protein NP233_g6887 [Leucocoprinus birnbaumii]|uniref:Autophagy-related protein 14 n=1 Tax=Leucocoprinus birnbaumii TaxID=56174 RepID=A0AAD5YQI7_9AGAR|nr:hypothetical protein NP233_g6887 [Leucocoprinus birnbaumii]